MKLNVKNLSWKCLCYVQSTFNGIEKVNIALCTLSKTYGAEDSIHSRNRNNNNTTKQFSHILGYNYTNQ